MRPTRPAARIRRVTRSTSADERRRRRPRAISARGPSARCEPIEPPAAADLHRPRIAVVGERVEVPARRPARASTPAPPRPSRATSPTVVIPRSWSLRGGHRPDAPQPLDRQRVEEGRARRRAATTSRPSGLATPLATLARNFVRATPTVIGSPTRSRTSRRSRTRDLGGRAGDPPQPARRRGTPRRSRAPRRAASCPRTPRTPPCSPRSRPTCAADDDRVRAQPARLPRRPSPCGRRTPSPRSSPRARRPPPTITGRPRSRGSSRCSTDA